MFFPYFSTSERAFLELLSLVQTKMDECEGRCGGVEVGVYVHMCAWKCVFAIFQVSRDQKGLAKNQEEGSKTEPLRKAAGNTESCGLFFLLLAPPIHF